MIFPICAQEHLQSTPMHMYNVGYGIWPLNLWEAGLKLSLLGTFLLYCVFGQPWDKLLDVGLVTWL